MQGMRARRKRQAARMARQFAPRIIPDAHDFTGELEDWDERLFWNFDHFRIHRTMIGGKGELVSDIMTEKNFAEAIAIREELLAHGWKVTVYCITAAGRSCALVDFDHYVTLWPAVITARLVPALISLQLPDASLEERVNLVAGRAGIPAADLLKAVREARK